METNLKKIALIMGVACATQVFAVGGDQSVSSSNAVAMSNDRNDRMYDGRKDKMDRMSHDKMMKDKMYNGLLPSPRNNYDEYMNGVGVMGAYLYWKPSHNQDITHYGAGLETAGQHTITDPPLLIVPLTSTADHGAKVGIVFYVPGGRDWLVSGVYTYFRRERDELASQELGGPVATNAWSLSIDGRRFMIESVHSKVDYAFNLVELKLEDCRYTSRHWTMDLGVGFDIPWGDQEWAISVVHDPTDSASYEDRSLEFLPAITATLHKIDATFRSQFAGIGPAFFSGLAANLYDQDGYAFAIVGQLRISTPFVRFESSQKSTGTDAAPVTSGAAPVYTVFMNHAYGTEGNEVWKIMPMLRLGVGFDFDMDCQFLQWSIRLLWETEVIFGDLQYIDLGEGGHANGTGLYSLTGLTVMVDFVF